MNQLTGMDFKAYLHRIHCEENLSPSLRTLALLQKQHLIHIPFENLDIHYGRPIVLKKEKIFNKVISKGRGGFCYELNGIYHELLSWIGFETSRISARVFNGNEFSAEFDHLALIVRSKGLMYLCDVGFGDFTASPLLLHPHVIQRDENGKFIIKQSGLEYTVYKLDGNDNKPMYKFENIPRSLVDFSNRCRYHQTSPESHFTQRKLITIATEQGRITLTDDKLKITEGALSSEFDIKDEDDFKEMLWKYYSIKISE